MKIRAADRERPWMGLHSFPEDSAEYFHGRRVEADELYSLCVRETLALLYGKSGLGKTSLIQAAISPRLRQNEYLPAVARLNYDQRAPSVVDQIVQHLKNSVQISKADLVLPEKFGTLWELFHHREFEIWSRTSRSLQTPVLILDQFEEYLINGADTAIGTELLANLRQLINNRPPECLADQENRYIRESFCCKILLAMREDFLANLEPLRREFPALKYNHYRLVPMTGAQARDAIICPAPELVDGNTANAILAAVSVHGWRPGMPIPTCEVLDKAEVSPALLSLLCDELNEKRIAHDQGHITADLVNENRDKILSVFFNRCFEGKPPSLRKFVEDQLVTGSGYRDHEEIAEALEKSGATQKDFDDLVDLRLLKYEEQGPVTWIELSHDLLVDSALASRKARKELERREAEERRRLEEQRLLQEKLEQEEARRIEQEKLHAEQLEQAQRRQEEERAKARQSSFRLKLVSAGSAVIFGLLTYTAWQTWELNKANDKLNKANKQLDLRLKELSAAQNAVSFASTISDLLAENASLALEDYSRDVSVVPESTKILLLGFLDSLEEVWKERDPDFAARTRANLAYSRMILLLGAGDVEEALRIAKEIHPLLVRREGLNNQYVAKFHRLEADLWFRGGFREDEPKEAVRDWEQAIELYQNARQMALGDDLFDSECRNRIGSTKRFIAKKQSDPLRASSLLVSAERDLGESVMIARNENHKGDPKWTMVLAEAYNKIGLIHKTRADQLENPERHCQSKAIEILRRGFRAIHYATARAWFALSRQTYQQLLTREPNSRIAIVRLVLATANQALVSEQLGDDRHLGDDWRHGVDWPDQDNIVPLLKDRVKYSRWLFETDRTNPYFAALLSTGLMIEASQIAGLTGEGDKELITPLKSICRGAFRLAQEALEITQCNLREDLFSTYERICSKLGYHEELVRVKGLERAAKSSASRPEPLQLSAPIRATSSTRSFDQSLPE